MTISHIYYFKLPPWKKECISIYQMIPGFRLKIIWYPKYLYTFFSSVLLSEKNTCNFSVFQMRTFLIVTYPFVLEIQWMSYQNGFEEKPLKIIKKDFCPSSIVMYFWSNISDIFMHNKQDYKSIHVVFFLFCFFNPDWNFQMF